MKIDPSTPFNSSGAASQNGLQANSATAVSNKAKENISSTQKQDPEKASEASKPAASGTVGGLALDEDKKVVVRFYDREGNVVAQYPPEDYLEMMKEFTQLDKNLFHTTA